jgi:hypothetical protein
MDIDGYKLHKCKLHEVTYYIIDKEGNVYVSVYDDKPRSSDKIWTRGDDIMIVRNEEHILMHFRKIDIEELYVSLLEDIKKYEQIMDANIAKGDLIFVSQDIKLYAHGGVLIAVEDDGDEYRGHVPHEVYANKQISAELGKWHECVYILPSNYFLYFYYEEKYLKAIDRIKKLLDTLEPFVTLAVLK